MIERIKCFFDDCVCGGGGSGSVCDCGVCDVGVGGGGGGFCAGEGGGVNGDGGFVVVLISSGVPAVCSTDKAIASVVFLFLA